MKAFGDKPWLMTRKFKDALIHTGPLAHVGKAVCYTKETPHLLRNTLNIPLLLGTKPVLHLYICPFYGCNSKQSVGLHPISFLGFFFLLVFFFWNMEVFRENQRENDGKSILLVWLHDGRKITFGQDGFY